MSTEDKPEAPPVIVVSPPASSDSDKNSSYIQWYYKLLA